MKAPEEDKMTVILAKNEGIFPFVDLIEYLSQKTIYDFTGRSQEHHFYAFKRDWSNSKLKIYFEVDENFLKSADLFALKSIKLIELFYTKERNQELPKILERGVLAGTQKSKGALLR